MTEFVAQNPFEEAMQSAQGGALELSVLLQQMLSADLIVPSNAEVAEDGSGMVPLFFDKEGTGMLAAFTDKSRLEPFKEQAKYALVMKGVGLVKMLPREYGLVINPGNGVGFDISPERMAALRAEAFTTVQ